MADPRYAFWVDDGQEGGDMDKFDKDLIAAYLNHKEWCVHKMKQAKEDFSKWSKNKKAKTPKWKRKFKQLSDAYDSWCAILESSVIRWNSFVECGSLNEVDLKFSTKKVCNF